MEQNHAEDKTNTMQRQRVCPVLQEWVHVAWTRNSLADIAQELVCGTGPRATQVPRASQVDERLSQLLH